MISLMKTMLRKCVCMILLDWLITRILRVDTTVEVATGARDEDTAQMAPILMLTKGSDMTPAMPTETVEERLRCEEHSSEAKMHKKSTS
jgi:hypothetical protein